MELCVGAAPYVTRVVSGGLVPTSCSVAFPVLFGCLTSNIGLKETDVTVDLHEVRFQCANCGADLQQTIGRLKANDHMTCPGCHIGINIGTNRLASAGNEIQKAVGRVPPEITIKFFR